ncbi:MAG: WYL domain-containing protein [Myxococcaceae bacterium]
MNTAPQKAGRTEVHERLRRLLFLVPYVAEHQGQSVEQVAKALGLTRSQLLEELDLLTLVGRPPFQPDDFIDIYVEDDKVYVDLDQRLSRPPRLTAAEGVALAAAAELLRPAARDALKSALSKLEKVLPEAARDRYRQMARQLDVSVEAPLGLAPLSQAIVEHREVEFDYFAAGTGQTGKRSVQPHELFAHRGQWYLSAWDTNRKDERLFRLDRIAQLTLTERAFKPSGAPKSLRPHEGDQKVTVRFSAQAAPFLVERFGAAARKEPGGGLTVEVPGDSMRWLTQWVLSFGGDAEVISPPSAREAVARAAKASIESAP